MRNSAILLFFFGIICSLTCTQSTSTKTKGNLFCYFPNWAIYWNGAGKFNAGDIDPFLCTHILYAFADMEENGAFRVYDEWADISCGLYANVTGLKKVNPALKVLISVGGWSEGSEKFSSMAKDPVRRATFINTTIAAIKQYGFDGLDLDWEYPGRRGGDEKLDKENFITLLKELREAFDVHKYLLTVAVAPASTYVDISYDIPAMTKYLDFINLMEYDYHGLWDGYTGYNAPLFPSPADPTANKREWNINASVKKWIAEGADPQKLIMGIPLYGRSYTLNNTTNMNIGVETWTPGPQSRYIPETGIYGYNEICEDILDGNWTIVWDKFSLVPYMYKDRAWVSYDDVESIKMKTRYGMNKKLGGFMVWSLATDDFLGNCGKKNILIHAIREVMGL